MRRDVVRQEAAVNPSQRPQRVSSNDEVAEAEDFGKLGPGRPDYLTQVVAKSPVAGPHSDRAWILSQAPKPHRLLDQHAPGPDSDAIRRKEISFPLAKDFHRREQPTLGVKPEYPSASAITHVDGVRGHGV